VSSFDDPFARLKAEADQLAASLAAHDPPASAELVEAAKSLARRVERTASALAPRRAADLRAALDDVEKRSALEEVTSQRARAEAKVAALEAEVSALLSPSLATTRAFYEQRATTLEAALRGAQARRGDVEAALSATASEMERSKSAIMLAACREEERLLAEELERTRERVHRFV
jgi:hypothetical protein